MDHGPDYPFTLKVIKRVFETIYHAAIVASMEIARSEGTFEGYHGAEISKGIFCFTGK